MSRSVFVDTSRLDRVLAWDPAWSDRPLASLQRQLTLDHGKRITFTGRQLLVDLGDVSLRSAHARASSLRIQYVDGRGEQKDLTVGELHNGPRQVLEVPLEGCDKPCVLEQLYVTGSSVSVSDVQGKLTILSVEVDHRLARWHLDPDSWRPARPFPVSLVDPPVVIERRRARPRAPALPRPAPPGQGRRTRRSAGSPGSRPRPRRTPCRRWSPGTRTETADQTGSGIALTYPASTVAGVSLNGQQVPMRVVDRVSTLPLVGTEGSLSDLETALVEFEPPSGALVTTQLLVADGTPAAVVDRVRAPGVGAHRPAQPLRRRSHDLRGDAFSLGLRLFLLVGVATLLIAVFGVFASAVLQSRWRSYEVASLRVVGVSQRALLRGSVLEYVVLLGVAVLLGVLSAYLSLLLVLPSISLGTAGVHDPAPVYATRGCVVAGVAAALFVLATLIAVLVSRRTTRRGRPTTLRWAEQG